MIQVRSQAPDFSCNAYLKGNSQPVKVSLADYRGKWTVLFFYPMDFTFVCPTELRAFAEAKHEIESLGGTVVAASCDSFYSHLAWFSKDLPEVDYPVLADKTGEIARKYGIYLENEGISLRGLFIIDPNGVLRYQVVTDLSVGRATEETIRVLQALQTGANCPANWKPGQKTL